MSDVWAETLHVASFAGIPIDVLTTRDSIDRNLVVQNILQREGGRVHDLGSMPRETECRVLFFERDPDADDPSELNHIDRLEQFLNAYNKGVAQEFVHPVTGSYNALARGASFEFTGEFRDEGFLDVTFVEDAIDPAPFELDSATPPQAGTSEGRVVARQLEQDLAAAGLESDVPASAIAAMDEWETNPDITSREINLQLQALSSKIANAIDELELATDVKNFSTWRSMQNLHATVRAAGREFRQISPTLQVRTLVQPINLLTWSTAEFGAEEARDRYNEIRDLNDIDDPTQIPAGTELRVPTPAVSGRTGLRSAPR